MKRLLCVLLLILFLGCYCSCKADINERYDLEEFGIYDSEHSICRSLLPRSFINEKGHFQKAYDYTDGAYYFDLSALFDFPVFERVLVWMEFDDENYELAKTCCFAEGEMSLSEEAVEEYSGYVFYDNYQTSTPEYIEHNKSQFPYDCARFAYNDEKNTLVFVSWHLSRSEESAITAEQIQNDWSTFLAENFGMWYSFDE